jgi:hypothetical protein
LVGVSARMTDLSVRYLENVLRVLGV